MAITKPSRRTYEAIASYPVLNGQEAWWWLFVALLVSSLLHRLLPILAGIQQETPGSSTAALMNIVGDALLCLPGFLICVWLLNLIARRFGGRASFNQVAYTLSAVFAPLIIVGALAGLLSLVPDVGVLLYYLLFFLLGGYQASLAVIAVKAVHHISWRGAVVAAIVPPVGLFVGIVALLMIFGPIIGGLLGL